CAREGSYDWYFDVW
nr:immunoglobulin heavy chain junction region [Mus musculus]